MSIISLPPPYAIKQKFPLSAQAQHFIQSIRKTSRDVVQGIDPRKVLIIGPCSIHNRASTLEYAKRFKALAQEVADSCLLVMRVYVEKARSGVGWKGLLYDPHLNQSHDIHTGLLWTRELFQLLAEMQVPCAAEFVDPLAALYFEDLVAWGFIGARTTASQPHRQFASQLEIPIGFKNCTDGNLDDSVLGALLANEPQTCMHMDEFGKLCAIQTQGNPNAHIVLRGSYHSTNYDAGSIKRALDKLNSVHLPQKLMIDCSHGNCQKSFLKQKEVFYNVLDQIQDGNEHIFGIMLESHLEEGSQPHTPDPVVLKPSVSITDPCLDWSATEKLVQLAGSVLTPIPQL